MTYIYFEMAQVFEKRLNYVGNDLDVGNGSDMSENDLISRQNGLKMWKMTKRFGKWPKYF